MNSKVFYKVGPANEHVSPEAVNSGLMLRFPKEQEICDFDFKPVPLQIRENVKTNGSYAINYTEKRLLASIGERSNNLLEDHYLEAISILQIHVWALAELVDRQNKSGVELVIVLKFME
jgi:hypothetical protein